MITGSGEFARDGVSSPPSQEEVSLKTQTGNFRTVQTVHRWAGTYPENEFGGPPEPAGRVLEPPIVVPAGMLDWASLHVGARERH